MFLKYKFQIEMQLQLKYMISCISSHVRTVIEKANVWWLVGKLLFIFLECLYRDYRRDSTVITKVIMIMRSSTLFSSEVE